jgi:hypothetical protein
MSAKTIYAALYMSLTIRLLDIGGGWLRSRRCGSA